jgi:tRNA(Ile)-lysidine synthase
MKLNSVENKCGAKYMNNKFEKEVFHTIQKYQMLEPGDKVLIGFSGGPDSMALLTVLYHIKKIFGIRLSAVHINHQLRAKAALKDEKFCLTICKKMGVPIKVCRVDVKKYALKHKLSVEEAARILRYQELIKLARQKKCQKIALGHNANDNTETVIMNLIRGTGLAGLSGIPPKRKAIIRPLIEQSRDEIIKYLHDQGVQYCDDLTNMELGYRRNYIRHKVVPMLQDINPNLIKTVNRTSEILRDMHNNLAVMVAAARKDILLKPKTQKKFTDRYLIDTRKFLSYNVLIRREIIKTMLPRLDFDAVNKVMTLIQKPAGKSVDLTKDYVAWKEYDKMVIGRKEQQINTSNHIWPIDIDKAIKISELNLTLLAKEHRSQTKSDTHKSKNEISTRFDKSAITLPLFIRLRKPGDRFIPCKGKETKLKDVLINDKIPVRARNQVPLLCDQHNILWIIGSRRSNIGLINSKTKEIIEVKVLN